MCDLARRAGDGVLAAGRVHVDMWAAAQLDEGGGIGADVADEPKVPLRTREGRA